MDMISDVVADTKRLYEEALQMLAAVQNGQRLAPGMTREAAVQVLVENIAHYEKFLERYDCGARTNRP